MQKITPFLWFDHQAEEAANFYVSLFHNSKILGISRYGAEGPGPEGSVMTVSFELNGQEYIALNGGPRFKFTEAVSFVINCDSQEEIDRYWTKLTADGGEESRCGWLTDRYGLSWQVVPRKIRDWMLSANPQAAQRVMAVVGPMRKLDMAAMERAFEGIE
jgi:predicted 3-demethylubiquinone-9 3-methyltransferase (glyoxalase superfamily)